MRILEFKILMTALTALTVMLMTTGCSPQAHDHSYEICTDSTAVSEASRMSRQLSPSQAAEALAEWMTAATLDNREFAANLFVALRDSFENLRPGSATALDRSLDSVFASRDQTDQARMLVLSAAPERVAAAITGDLLSRLLIPEIERLYSADSMLLRRFRRAARSIRH